MVRITITGADDRVNPVDLFKLSERFPFVEWGVLMSASRQGDPRYPTDFWITSLCRARPRFVYVAAHLCGATLRAAMQGGWVWPATVQRVQLNGYASLTPAFLELARHHEHRYEFILQCRREADLPVFADDTRALPAGSVLYDPSGGRGIETFSWPRPPLDCPVGFAGGIDESNVEAVIGECVMASAHSNFWIDLETGARTDDRFDLEKVERILSKVAAVNARIGGA